MLGLAIKIAVNVHEGQTDKGGNPYILHPLRVMMSVESESEKIVAILHDVVEDSDGRSTRCSSKDSHTRLLKL